MTTYGTKRHAPTNTTSTAGHAASAGSATEAAAALATPSDELRVKGADFAEARAAALAVIERSPPAPGFLWEHRYRYLGGEMTLTQRAFRADEAEARQRGVTSTLHAEYPTPRSKDAMEPLGTHPIHRYLRLY